MPRETLTPGRYRFTLGVDGRAVRVQTRSRLARWLHLFTGADGFTWGDRVFLRGAMETVAHEETLGTPWATGHARGRRRLVAHEVGHVRQFARLGTWGFLRRYVWQVLHHGYRSAPLERDAIAFARIHGDAIAEQVANAWRMYQLARAR